MDTIDIRPKEKQEEKPIKVKRTTKDILKEFRKELAKARQNAKVHDIVIDTDFYQESEKINKEIENK